MSVARKKTAVLISGRGSNMAALVAAAGENDFPAEIVCVISDQAEAAGLHFAATHGIATSVVRRADHASREAHETAIDAALRAAGVEIVALAGYMRRLSPAFVDAWHGRMINIHPSLLPSLKGLDTHARALAAGLRIHGCTVHFVTPEVDDGPIIGQAAVPVNLGDSEAALAARVLKAEHHLYVLALRLLAEEKVRMEAGRSVFRDVHAIQQDGVALHSPSGVEQAVDLEALARFTP